MGFNEKNPSFQQLRSIIAERRSPIVFWIGAGVSADAGLPSWAELRSKLTEAALEDLLDWTEEDDAQAAENKLDDSKDSDDLWKSFELIREILGWTSYKERIRELLALPDRILVPELHKMIWSVPNVRGVVSLNIDGLEGRACKEAGLDEDVTEFVGKKIGSHCHLIQHKKPFIARLHGHHADATSWVFTESDLKSLTSNGSYTTSVQSLFTNYTVIFLGISADDVAAGGFLKSMSDFGVDTGAHFWITDRTDRNTREWSDKAGLQRVSYKVEEDTSHTEVLLSMFDNIKAHISHDTQPNPIEYSGEEKDTIQSPEELNLLSDDEVRRALNSHAKHILRNSANQPASTAYQEFLRKYSRAVHQAWHINEDEGSNKFFGYTVVGKIHSGPFSSVWRLVSDDGVSLALKIMQLDNLRKGPQIQSFRRGIASQQLLRDSKSFDGMAEIVEAFEIPPSVIMEFVEGESLEEICNDPAFDFWSDGLELMKNVCSEVSKAHRSQFGILHRDIRPTNIMIPNHYIKDCASDYNLDEYQVKLLNYDLSWHKDASGKVVPVNPMATGFYAPELLNESDDTRARNASVDAYGIGMTILKIASGLNPPLAGSGAQDWEASLDKIKSNRNSWFQASHCFIQRLVVRCTKKTAIDRPLISDIEADLTDLSEALKVGTSKAAGRFLAENLMYSLCENHYEVLSSGYEFVRNLNGSLRYRIYYKGKSEKLLFSFDSSATNQDTWTKIDKTWKGKLRSASEILRSGGWKVTEDEWSNRVLFLSAETELSKLHENYDRMAQTLDRAVNQVRPS